MLNTSIFDIFQPLLESVLLPHWEVNYNARSDSRSVNGTISPADQPGLDESTAKRGFQFQETRLLLMVAFFVLAPMLAEGQTWFNGQVWHPKPLPAWHPPKNKSLLTVNRPVRFNLKTRTETVLDAKSGTSFSPKSEHGNPGDLPPGKPYSDQPSLLKSGGPLEPVADPTASPARMNVKLFVKKGNSCWPCSGSLIDSRHVVTAGHCIFDGGWADTVFVVPAFTGEGDSTCYELSGTIPFGVAIAVNDMMSWTGWTQQDDYEWDMGILFLERPVGALTGWFGFGASEDPDFYGGNFFHNFSYPADPPHDGNSMYYRQVVMSFHYESETIFLPEPTFWDSLYVYHLDYTFGGQSGSGYYMPDFGSRYIHAVVSHGDSTPFTSDDYTGIAYIHLDQFDHILDYRNDNIPNALDLIPLWAQAGNETIVAGNMLNNFSFKVHNYSHPTFNGTTETKVFLSTNNIITADDTQLGVVSGNLFLAERNTTTITLSADQPTIPATTPPGDYYLGVVLDLADANTDNNTTGIWDVDKITVFNVLVTPDTLEVPVSGGIAMFDIEANAYWFISEDADWLTISQFNGTGNATVQVTCTANPSSNPREYTLLVVGPNGLQRPVLVRQAGVELSVAPGNLQVSACGGEVNFEADANFPWAVETVGIDWLAASPQGGGPGDGWTVFLNCLRNVSEQPRQDTINIVAGQVVVPVVVWQAGIELAISPDSSEVPACGGEVSFAVSANCPWELQTDENDWLGSSTIGGGPGYAVVEVQVEPNGGPLPRQATYTVVIGQVEKQIVISQQGAELTAFPGLIQMPTEGDTTFAQVFSNTCWEVSSSASWLNVSPPFGEGDGQLQVVCGLNCGSNHEGIITLFAEGGIITQTITVMQAGPHLSVMPGVLQIEPGGGTPTIWVDANLDWTATSSDPEWLTPIPDTGTGTGNEALTLSCLANPGTASRQAIVTIETDCGAMEITVIQAGQAAFISTDPDTLHFPHTRDTQVVVVFSNVAWSVVGKPAWLSVVPVNGFGSDSLTVICQQNSSWLPRSGILKLAAGGLHWNIFVFQQRKYLISVPGDPMPLPPSTDDLLHRLTGGSGEMPAGLHGQNEVNVAIPDQQAATGISLSVFPNPSKGIVSINFGLPYSQAVRLEVFDGAGRQVTLMENGQMGEGMHKIIWQPNGLPPGMYVCRLLADGQVFSEKIILSY